MEQTLNVGNLSLNSIRINLVDSVWGAERPPRPINPVTQLDFLFTGKTVQDKLSQIRLDVEDEGAEALLITELDEIACL